MTLDRPGVQRLSSWRMAQTRGARLKEARERAGYTQRQVAELYRITSGTVSRWECDEATLSLDQVEALAKLYVVGVSWLAFGIGPRRPRGPA